MRLKPMIALTTILLITMITTGCAAENGENGTDRKLTIYTTIYPIKDFTAKIGGDHVKVKNLIPPGSDAHTFEPTPQTMIEIAESDALIYNGAGIEGYIHAIKDSLRDRDVRFVAASSGIALREYSGHSEHHEEHSAEGTQSSHDPHIWLDPNRAIEMAENIKNALVKMKPEASKDFEENYVKLKNKLENLNDSFRKMVKTTPNDTFLTSHAAYGYWEQRYGLKQLSISGLSPTDEPSQKQLQQLIEKAKKHDIQYVLFEQNVSSNVAKVIQEEIGAEPLYLYNLSSPPEKTLNDGEDYFSLMNENIETLKIALK